MYQFKDTEEFHAKYPTKEAKERALAELDDEEIYHLATTCTNKTGQAWYASHMSKNRKKAE